MRTEILPNKRCVEPLITNDELAAKTIAMLEAAGVREWCFAAGMRNAPFVKIFDRRSDVGLWPEERSMAFFALGRARRVGPVAVVTTSGTAAAELLPAAMEGYYSGVPLVLVTADRPERMRMTGAPQTCVQPGLFGLYAPTVADLSVAAPDVAIVIPAHPIHLNIQFEEPL